MTPQGSTLRTKREWPNCGWPIESRSCPYLSAAPSQKRYEKHYEKRYEKHYENNENTPTTTSLFRALWQVGKRQKNFSEIMAEATDLRRDSKPFVIPRNEESVLLWPQIPRSSE